MGNVSIIIESMNYYELPLSSGAVIGEIAVAIAIALALYLFLSIALFVMAKRRNIEIAWLSYIPVARWAVMCRLVGKINFFGRTFKSFAPFAVTAIALHFAITTFYNVFYYFPVVDAFFKGNDITYYLGEGVFYINSTSLVQILVDNYPQPLIVVMQVIEYARIVTVLASIIAEVALYFAIFRLYIPERYLLFSLLAIFLEIGGILLFAIRKRDPVDYREFLKRRYGMYTGGYNGEGQAPGQAEEPFGDFNEREKSSEEKDPFSDFGNENK